MVVFAVGISRRMMELRWTSLQCVVATSGYMAVMIDFFGLVAARRQADPGANRSRFLKVVRPLNGVVKAVAVIAPMPGIDIRMRQA